MLTLSQAGESQKISWLFSWNPLAANLALTFDLLFIYIFPREPTFHLFSSSNLATVTRNSETSLYDEVARNSSWENCFVWSRVFQSKLITEFLILRQSAYLLDVWPALLVICALVTPSDLKILNSTKFLILGYFWLS